jgi:hypothetical protein
VTPGGRAEVTAYISIGNSDDKLTQAEWAGFYRRTNLAIREFAQAIHGQWVSEPASPWQNACWCAVVDRQHIEGLKVELRKLAGEYRQDSVAWAEVPGVEFLRPATGDPE